MVSRQRDQSGAGGVATAGLHASRKASGRIDRRQGGLVRARELGAMSGWDDFQIVGELQEQNQHLLLQLDEKDRELREVQNYMAKIQVSQEAFLFFVPLLPLLWFSSC